MAVFYGSPFIGAEAGQEKISADAVNIGNNITEMTAGRTALLNKFTDFETESNTYAGEYEGDSKAEYMNAYRVLEYRQDRLQDIFTSLGNTLDRNACSNTAINQTADRNAGGKN